MTGIWHKFVDHLFLSRFPYALQKAAQLAHIFAMTTCALSHLPPVKAFATRVNVSALYVPLPLTARPIDNEG